MAAKKEEPQLTFFKGSDLRRDRLRKIISMSRQLDDEERTYDLPYGLTLGTLPDKVLTKWIRQSHGYTADVGGTPVGMVMGGGGDYDNARSVSQLFVQPEFRRRGIARLLLRRMVEDNRAEGKKSLLRVSDNNHNGARRLYESEGFRPISTIMATVGPEEKSAEAVTSSGLLRYFVKSAESKPVFGSKEYVVAQYGDVDRAVDCGKESKEWQAAEAIVRTMDAKKTGARVYRVVRGTGYDGTIDKDTTKVFAHIVIGLNGPGRETDYLKELAKAIGATNHILEVQIDALDDLWDVIIVLDKESYAKTGKED